MNHLDLFSGIGGFSLGIKEAGIKHGWHGYSDIDKYANKIFGRHFNEAEKLGGIESIQPRDLPRLDLVTFGFPCQDLSVAGKRGGLTASRSGLFFEAMRIIRAKRPRYIIFENVKGLLSSNEGYDFIVCLQEIADIGYDGQWQLLNTRWFLPQNRERVYFVGHLRGTSRPKVFPIEENDRGNQELKFQRKATNGDRQTMQDSEDRGRRSLHRGRINILGNLKGDQGHEVHNVHDPQGIAPTVRWNHNCATLIKDAKIRRLTPVECCRLQGFPDDWCDGQSDTQKYKQLGNTVSVPVVRTIIERMKTELIKE
tara:strand:- start:3167 stop:4099 length:933 start_codon:yes stop_codon:yes gene_type:complete